MIKLPEKYYVGIRAQADEEGQLPLAFATPFGSDAAFTKRKSTVDNWTGTVDPNRKENPRFETYDNVLVEGFRISQSVRRSGWNGGGNVLWRIEDPRGFELEISSGNFASIVDCSTLVNGVIEGKCIWGREGSANVLLPEASAPYQEAINFTNLSKLKVAAKDMIPGQMVRMKDDAVAMFMGEFYGLEFCHYLEHRGFAASRLGAYPWEKGDELPPFHTVNANPLNKRAVFLHEEFVDQYIADGTLPLHREFPRHYGISHTMFSYSGFKNVAKLEKRKEVINQEAFAKLIEADVSVWGDSIFPNATATLIGLKPFKDVTLKFVEGEVHRHQIAKFVVDPQSVTHYVYDHNFHCNRWVSRSRKDTLKCDLMEFDAGAFTVDTTLKAIRQTVVYEDTADVLVGWKAGVVEATSGGHTAPIKLPGRYYEDHSSIFKVKPPQHQ